MESMEKLHGDVKQVMDGMTDTLYGINDYLFEHPELSDEEHESAAWLTKLLADNGFAITLPYAGVATAFRAEFTNGEGPTIGFLAEYDALPGYGPEKKPAHACGHSWIAATTVGAALALAKMKDRWNGKVVVFGCPAEETAGRKAEMVRAGAFDDVDAAFQMHLNITTNLKAVALAMDSCEFEFFGKASHAAAAPEAGINALDAVIMVFNGVAVLRQQLTDDVRIHGIVTAGGEAANIIPDHCKCMFYVRAAKRATMLDAYDKVMNIAKGAALMTGTRMEVHKYENQFDDLIVNPKLAERFEAHMLASGFPELDPEWEIPGSTDVGNVSYACPVLYGNVGVGDGVIGCHEEAFLPLVVDEEGRLQLYRTTESFVAAALELYDDPALVKEVRALFKKATGK